MLSHSRQIQQGSEIDVLKSSSNFYHLTVSMREVFPEIFNFIAQFSLTLWLFKTSENFEFANFFHFQGFLLSDSFYC